MGTLIFSRHIGLADYLFIYFIFFVGGGGKTLNFNYIFRSIYFFILFNFFFGGGGDLK